MTRLLVSIDVGGTLGHADGPSLAATLARASPLDPAVARHLVRRTLHTQPTITPAVVDDVCAALGISPAAFPREVRPQPLRLMPGALDAVQTMSRHATLVTLSNVTCLEADATCLHAQLHPWVSDHFQSCHTGYAKPDPAAFHRVAYTCGISTANMIHVGDDWTCDVEGARSAGVTAIWLSKGRRVPDHEQLPGHGVLVVGDLAAASRQITELALRRQP